MTAASKPLMKLSQVRRQIAACRSVDELKDIRDRAEALRAYTKQAGECLEVQNDAAEIKLRAERRAGEILAGMGVKQGRKGKGSIVEPLAELGLTKKQSHRWQQAARIPVKQFEAFLAETRGQQKEITSAAVRRLAAKLATPRRKTRHAGLGASAVVGSLEELSGHQFGTIYADPPWQYANRSTRSAADKNYDTMTVDQLCGMPVKDIAAADAHLHLWTTNAFLPDAFRVIEAWGFEYRSCYVWVKPQMGIGNYWRVSHEFLLLGIRGAAKSFAVHDQKSWGQFDRTKHSAKPHEIRNVIERVSPGPFLEMFGRYEVDRWTVMGNQVAQFFE